MSMDANFRLVECFYVEEAVNKKGLRRGKKDVIEMQDFHSCCYPFGSNSRLSLFCIYDGHAGVECARALSDVMPKQMRKALRRACKARVKIMDMRDVFMDVFRKCDMELRKWDWCGSTCTVCVVWCVGDDIIRVQCANVGDSSCILVTPSDEITKVDVVSLSRDHRPWDEDERSRIRSEGILLSDTSTRIGGLSVTRALGDAAAKRENCGLSGVPYVSEVILAQHGQWIVLASDGLWDTLSHQACAQIIQRENDAKKATKRLMKQALSSFKCNDNVTVITVKI